MIPITTALPHINYHSTTTHQLPQHCSIPVFMAMETVTYIPVVFQVIVMCTPGIQQDRKNTTHKYRVKCFCCFFVFRILTMCSIPQEYNSTIRIPQPLADIGTQVHGKIPHVFCGNIYSCGNLCGKDWYRMKYHRTFLYGIFFCVVFPMVFLYHMGTTGDTSAVPQESVWAFSSL